MGGPKLHAMAWRNLWRHRRRTLITLSSIGFGTMFAVVFTGIGDANWGEMIDLAARTGGGHVTLQHPEYLETPALTRTLVGTAALGEAALLDPDVTRVAPRITGQLMLSTAGQSYGAGFVAFDPAREDTSTLSIIEAVAEGEIFRASRGNGLLLGRQLAENLGAQRGSKVIYTLIDKQGEIVYGVARVSGIVATGAPTVDAGLCLLPIDSVREVLGYGSDEVTQLAVFVGDQRRSEVVAARLAERLPTAIATLPWFESRPELSGFIAMKVASARVMEGVIMVLVAAGIFNTLFVGVMERLREFGTMLAIGFSPATLFALVMWESLWMALMGLVTAALMTAWPYWYLATRGLDLSAQMDVSGSEVAGVAVSTVMHARIYPESLAIICTAVVIATLLSGIYPAWRAGRVMPAEAIRLQ